MTVVISKNAVDVFLWYKPGTDTLTHVALHLFQEGKPACYVSYWSEKCSLHGKHAHTHSAQDDLELHLGPAVTYRFEKLEGGKMEKAWITFQKNPGRALGTPLFRPPYEKTAMGVVMWLLEKGGIFSLTPDPRKNKISTLFQITAFSLLGLTALNYAVGRLLPSQKEASTLDAVYGFSLSTFPLFLNWFPEMASLILTLNYDSKAYLASDAGQKARKSLQRAKKVSRSLLLSSGSMHPYADILRKGKRDLFTMEESVQRAEGHNRSLSRAGLIASTASFSLYCLYNHLFIGPFSSLDFRSTLMRAHEQEQRGALKASTSFSYFKVSMSIFAVTLPLFLVMKHLRDI